MVFIVTFSDQETADKAEQHFKTTISLFHGESKRVKESLSIKIVTNLSKNQDLVMAALQDEMAMFNLYGYSVHIPDQE